MGMLAAVHLGGDGLAAEKDLAMGARRAVG